MKPVFAHLLLFWLMALSSFGQSAQDSLTNDSLFRQSLLKSIRYPAPAQRTGRVANVYVGFAVNQLGQITNVAVLNRDGVDALFEAEVSRFMKLLPAQKPAYAGSYVLPVVFSLEGAGKTVKPRDEVNPPIASPNERILLKEIYVTGYL